MDTFLDVSGIVKRAKQALNFKKDSELASYLGVSRATLSNWCARNRIDFHLLLNKMRDVDRSVALYDITAAANLKTLLTNKRQYMVGKIQIPSIPLCDGAVYISGDSMYPILKSGDIVGFKEINSFSNLIYGEMYLVSFTIEGDEYLAVKYVNRSEKEGCLKLVSYNAHHDPMDIPFSTINAMAIVKFSIRRHMMM